MPDESRSYRLSPQAEEDLEEIWLYTYRSWSIEQADRYVADIVAAFEDLAVGRTKGRPVEVRQGYSKLSVGAHVVFYRRSESCIDVIRILNQRMDFGRHL